MEAVGRAVKKKSRKKKKEKRHAKKFIYIYNCKVSFHPCILLLFLPQSVDCSNDSRKALREVGGCRGGGEEKEERSTPYEVGRRKTTKKKVSLGSFFSFIFILPSTVPIWVEMISSSSA